MVNTHVNKPNSSILIILLLVFLNVGGLLQCGSSVPPEYREFLSLPRDKQREEIKKFSLEKQVDIYVWGLYSEPPDASMADEVAKNGKEVIPILLKRLAEEKSEYIKANLFYVFVLIHKSHYNLKKDNQTLEVLKRIIDEMKDPNHRPTGESFLKFILDDPGFNDQFQLK